METGTKWSHCATRLSNNRLLSKTRQVQTKKLHVTVALWSKSNETVRNTDLVFLFLFFLTLRRKSELHGEILFHPETLVLACIGSTEAMRKKKKKLIPRLTNKHHQSFT